MFPPKTLLLALVAGLLFAAPAGAQPITGLTKSNQIFTFDSATPGTVSANQAVTGLNAGDTLLAIDRNPKDGELYALGSQSRIYRISANAAATQIGPVLNPLVAGTCADIDFNSSGALRIVSETDQNLVWNLENFNVTTQTALAFANGNPNFGNNPGVCGFAYSSNLWEANGQTAYAYHFQNDRVETIGNVGGGASSGQLNEVGMSGISANDAAATALDIAPDGTAFAVMFDNAVTSLYTLNTASGALTIVGAVGNGGNTVADIATDSVANQFRFGASVYSIDENGGVVTLAVKRSQPQGFARIDVMSADASAAAGQDYDAQSTNVIFFDGQTEKTVDIRVQPDAFDENDETLTVSLANPQGGHAALVAPSTTVVQIQDDDSGPVPSTPVTVLTQTNELVTLDSASPGTVSAPLAISGLPGGEELIGIDRRPATGGLYAVSKQSRLFRIDESSGAATQIGDVFSPPLALVSGWGVDFDPVTDRLRIVSSGGSGQQLRVNPDDGSVTTDSPLIFNAGDQYAGTPNLAGIAYSDNVPGATSTTLWAYDYTHDSTARVGSPGGAPVSPSSGATSTIAPSLIRASGSGNLGLDIGVDGRAWGLVRQAGKTRLHLVNLATGEVPSVGDIGTGTDLYRDLALPALSQSIELGGTSFSGSEASGVATVTVTRSQNLGAASVAYATSDGSAAAGSDYTATNGTLTFGAGETSKAISIPVSNDSAVESPESLSITIADPRGGIASLGGTTSATVNIADNDTAGGGGGGQVDSKAVVKLCGSTKQDLVKQKSVVVCLTSNEASTADLTGKLTIAGVKKPITLTKLSAQKLTANKQAKLKVKLSKSAIGAVKTALKKRKKATATIAIKVKDAGGNVSSASRKVTAQAAKKKKK